MTKLTEIDKLQIIQLIEGKSKSLGSDAAVATFCKVSPATIALMKKNDYQTKGDEAWLNVGTRLGWHPEGKNTWNIAQTTDFKSVYAIVNDSKMHSLFLSISDVAGCGKTTSLKAVADAFKNDNVFYIQCMDWGKREFLEKLAQQLGIDTRSYKTPNALLELVIDFFNSRRLLAPVLIVDEFDKLKDAAKRVFIPLYNYCEDSLGCVVAGTEHLEDEIKKGVRHKKKGFDELDSRFGRKHIKLMGCQLSDVNTICNANGVTDDNVIKEIFEECKPVRKLISLKGREISIRVTNDLRRLKRLVKVQQLKSSLN